MSDKLTATSSGNNYIKFPDGIMIQWGTVSLTTATTAANYPAFGIAVYRAANKFNYPIPFIDIPAVVIDGDNVLYGAIGIIASATTKETFNVEVGHNAANATIKGHWIAIGRWK